MNRRAPRSCLRLWTRRALLTLSLLSLAGAASLPLAVRLGLIALLERSGADRVEIADVEIAPLAGSLILEGLRIERGGRTRLSCERLELALAVSALVRRRIEIAWLRVRGLILYVDRPAGDTLVIGGLAISPTEGEGRPRTRSGWGIGWRGLVVTDSRIVYEGIGGRHTLTIADGYVGRAASWRATRPARLSLTGAIDSAPLGLHGDSAPFSTSAALDLAVDLQALELGPIAGPWLPDPLHLSGRLAIVGRLSLARGDAGPRMAFRGRTTISDLHLVDGPLELRAARFEGHGDLALNGGTGAGGSGTLTAHRVAASIASGQWLAIGRLAIDGLAAHGDGLLSIDDILVERPRLRLRRLHDGETTLDRITEALANPPPAAGERAPPTAGQDAPAWRIGKIGIRDGEVAIVDEAVTPPFEGRLTVDRLDLGPLADGHPEQSARFLLRAGFGDFGRLSFEGTGWPFDPGRDLAVQGRIEAIDLSPFSPYGRRWLGYRIDDGQLGADIDVRSTEGRLDGQIEVHLTGLELSPAVEATIDRITARLTMPLPTALAVLSDDEGRVRIRLPVTGDLRRPDFGLGPLIEQIAGIALRKAVTTYLGTMLQPYSTIFTIAGSAIEMFSAIPLDPMPFEAGTDTITPTARDYAIRLARLLRDRPALSLHLCGRATPGDARALATAGVPPPELEPRLLALARNRADALKRLLVDEHEIEAARLFVCRPEVDDDPAAVPRIDLSL